MSYTIAQIEEAVGEHNADTEYEGAYNELHYGEDVEVKGLGKLEYVDSFGGEGQGDDYWVVFKLGGKLYRKDGYYASYDGGELDGELYEVEPVQVSRTEYRSKKVK